MADVGLLVFSKVALCHSVGIVHVRKYSTQLTRPAIKNSPLRVGLFIVFAFLFLMPWRAF
jgi:hypothetical protein